VTSPAVSATAPMPQAQPKNVPATMSPTKWKSAPRSPIATARMSAAHNQRQARGASIHKTVQGAVIVVIWPEGNDVQPFPPCSGSKR
jgi:hypothetical protein